MSALCDGECDELELRRVLNHIENDTELHIQWSNFHLIGAAMRDESISTVDLSRGVVQALDGEPMDDVPASIGRSDSEVDAGHASQPDLVQSSKRTLPVWMVSSSVAASVTLVVLLGARLFANSDVGTLRHATVQQTNQNTASEYIANDQSALLVSELTVDSSSERHNGALQRDVVAQLRAEDLAAAQEVLRQYLANQELGENTKQPSSLARVASFGKESGVRDGNEEEVQQRAASELGNSVE